MSLVPSTVDVEKLLESADSLTPLPVSALRLAALASNPEVEVHNIVETVTLDPSLTASVLRHANSAASGNRIPIGTVADAVVRLGMNTVVSIALASHLSRQMVRPLPEYGLSHGELWKQSVLASIAADLIRKKSRERISAEVVTAALLHDVGKLVLRQYRNEEVLGWIALAATTDDRSDFEAERVILEVHHGEVGALVAQNWRLPETIAMGVQYHHTPDEHPDPLCYAVSLSDVIADYLLFTDGSLGDDGRNGHVDPGLGLEGRERARLTEALTALDISPDALQDVLQGTAKRFARTRQQYLIED